MPCTHRIYPLEHPLWHAIPGVWMAMGCGSPSGGVSACRHPDLGLGFRVRGISDPLKMAISTPHLGLNGTPFGAIPSPFGPFWDPFWDPISSIP